MWASPCFFSISFLPQYSTFATNSTRKTPTASSSQPPKQTTEAIVRVLVDPYSVFISSFDSHFGKALLLPLRMESMNFPPCMCQDSLYQLNQKIMLLFLLYLKVNNYFAEYLVQECGNSHIRNTFEPISHSREVITTFLIWWATHSESPVRSQKLPQIFIQIINTFTSLHF